MQIIAFHGERPLQLQLTSTHFNLKSTAHVWPMPLLCSTWRIGSCSKNMFLQCQWTCSPDFWSYFLIAKESLFILASPKVLGPVIYEALIKILTFDDFDEFEIRLVFYISLSTFWNIPGGLFNHFYLLMSKSWLKIILSHPLLYQIRKQQQ